MELELEGVKGEESAGDDEGEDAKLLEKVSLDGHRILLCEDNMINAEIAKVILSKYGVELDRAENGEAGLNKVKDGGEGFYSAVLMDIQMPVMNGYEATRTIRGLNGEYYKKIPIIAMSANAYEEDVKEALDSGMNAHVAKPFEPDDLARTLKKHIQSAS